MRTVEPRLDQAELEMIGRELLLAIGEDPERAGLRETPARFAHLWREFIDYRDENAETTFETVRADQIVVVKGIEVHSLCEHHLLPFWCTVDIGYITRERILGLSKFARIAQQCAHRLQVQERLVEEVADEIGRVTQSPDVAVRAVGRHMCQELRGIRSQSQMVTQVLRGDFRADMSTRDEFLALVR